MTKNTVFILAAGFGTRLRPLTLHRPKPLLPLLGRPMIDHALDWLRSHGHSSIMVNAHHLWEQVAEWAHQRGVEIQVELPDILGTGGGLKSAEDRLAERFLIWNGDIISNIDPNALLNATPTNGAAMALRQSDNLGKTTPLSVDTQNRVDKIGDLVSAEGAPDWPIRPNSGLHFTGIHAMSRQSLGNIPETPNLRCVVRTAYVSMIPNHKVKATIHHGFWRDAGTPVEYLQANLDALAGDLPIGDNIWDGAMKDVGNNWISQSASVKGHLENCIVGPNATIPENAALRDCVVWDGVVVQEGKHQRCIFHDGGMLQVED